MKRRKQIVIENERDGMIWYGRYKIEDNEIIG